MFSSLTLSGFSFFMMLRVISLFSDEILRFLKTSILLVSNSRPIWLHRVLIAFTSACSCAVNFMFSLVQINPLQKCLIHFTEYALSEKIFLINVSSKLFLSNQKSTWAKNLEKGFDNFDSRTSSWDIHFVSLQNQVRECEKILNFC